MQKYENVEVFQLRKLERLSIKTRKAELGINCKIFNVIPKVLTYHIQVKLIQNLFVKDYCEVR